jgi:hypothetical protein
LEEHIVVEESIASVRHDQEVEHRIVEDSFETLHEECLHAWSHIKKKAKKASRTMSVSQFPADKLAELRMTAFARHMAAWEAEASGSSGKFAYDVEESVSKERGAVDDAEALDTRNCIDVIDVFTVNKEYV